MLCGDLFVLDGEELQMFRRELESGCGLSTHCGFTPWSLSR